jgi:hypothetical protein
LLGATDKQVSNQRQIQRFVVVSGVFLSQMQQPIGAFCAARGLPTPALPWHERGPRRRGIVFACPCGVLEADQ